MRRAVLVALVAVLACDDQSDPPPTCLDWLQCYNQCQPWGDESDDNIVACDQSCRTELGYHAEDPTPSADVANLLLGTWQAVITAERLAFKQAYDMPADPDGANSNFAFALQKRGECVDRALEFGE